MRPQVIAFPVEGEATSVFSQNEISTENVRQQLRQLPATQEIAGLWPKGSNTGVVLQSLRLLRKRRQAIAFFRLFLQALQRGWSDHSGKQPETERIHTQTNVLNVFMAQGINHETD